MSPSPRSSPNKRGGPRSSTGSPGPTSSPSKAPKTDENTVPVTAEFYRRHLDPLVFMRVLGYVSIVFYCFLVYMSKRTKNLTSPFYLSFMKVHTRVSEFYLVLLDLYKRCPAVTGMIKKLRFEVPYFMKLFSLYLPKHERKIMYLTNFNTLNNWVSLFVILTFMFLIELFVTILDNMIVSYRSRNSERYCTNMVHSSQFHDKSFTQEQLSKLLLSKEYLELKNSRHGLGPEAWNWQLRKTLKKSTHLMKSQSTHTAGDESDSSA